MRLAELIDESELRAHFAASRTSVRDALSRLESAGIISRQQGKGAFQAAGLQDGDVVTAIGGRPIGSVADLEQLQNGQTTGVTIERGGQSLPVTLPAGAR